MRVLEYAKIRTVLQSKLYATRREKFRGRRITGVYVESKAGNMVMLRVPLLVSRNVTALLKSSTQPVELIRSQQLVPLVMQRRFKRLETFYYLKSTRILSSAGGWSLMVKSNIFSRVLWNERISDELKSQRTTLRGDKFLGFFREGPHVTQGVEI